MVSISELTLVGTLLIFVVSAYHLYLSEFKERRSAVELYPKDFAQNAFMSGSETKWEGRAGLKITNTSERGATVSSVHHSLKALKVDEECVEPLMVDFTVPVTTRDHLKRGNEIMPNLTQGYYLRFFIECDDPAYLVKHDSAVIRHKLVVEDSKGSYECIKETELALTGPPEVALEDDTS